MLTGEGAEAKKLALPANSCRALAPTSGRREETTLPLVLNGK